MSWFFENVGTAEQVEGALAESAAQSHGVPPAVASYLRDAIAACVPSASQGQLISVKSSGHRPIISPGTTELCEVKLVQSGPRSK